MKRRSVLRLQAVLFWNHIGNQSFFLVFISRLYYCFLYFMMPAKHRLDFSKLNTEASNFNLFIEPTKVLNAAIRQVASFVAGFIKACSWVLVEWVGKESLSCQLGLTQVAT